MGGDGDGDVPGRRPCRAALVQRDHEGDGDLADEWSDGRGDGVLRAGVRLERGGHGGF